MVMQCYPAISAGEDCEYISDLERGLCVASSYAGSVMNKYCILTSIPVPKLPVSICDRAGDWGGYRVVKDWEGKAPFTQQQYVDWLSSWEPCWAATWDYPCSDEKASSSPTVVQTRQDETTLMAWYFWHHYKNVPWCWVPTVQGWTVGDYRRHAQDLYPLVKKMQAYYGQSSAFRVGIGSLVGRRDAAVKAIANTVAEELPGTLFHVWGAWKLKHFKSPIAWHEQVVSTDSGAFNGRFGKGLEMSGIQRQVVFQERLPKYQQATVRAGATPKQHKSLFDEIEEIPV